MPDKDTVIASLLRQREVLAKFGELALRSDCLDEILTEACSLVSDALGTELAKVMELRGDGMTLLVRAGVGWAPGIVGEVTVQALRGSSEGFALQTGKPVISEDISSETRFEYADFIKDNGVKAIASVIILGTEGGQPFGILQVDSRRPRLFEEDDTRFLQGYANLIAAAVDRLQVADGIRFTALHDPVTSLPNREMFRGALDIALLEAKHANEPLSLLLIDLDRFKQINDLLGHQVGDAALCAFAARVVSALPPEAVLARLGGDEFIAMLPGVAGAEAAGAAQRILDALIRPFVVAERHVDLRASLGISTFPGDGRSSPQLVRNADLALYSAKRDGGSRACAFAAALSRDHQGKLAMLRHARSALKNGWITPHYQVQVALGNGKVRGYEALLRWRHPRAGLQYPVTIAHAFDDPRTAGPLGQAMAEAAMADLKGWALRGRSTGKLAINVAAAEFLDLGYAQRLLARLAQHGMDPALLEVELTETAFLDAGASRVVTALEELRGAGVTVALDDFGTGFSSLSHLRDLPVDAIKIDRSFISGLEHSSKDRAIVRAILMLGHALQLETVAEGVETVGQAEFLTEHGCIFAQGYLFGTAIDAVHAEHQMAAGL